MAGRIAGIADPDDCRGGGRRIGRATAPSAGNRLGRFEHDDRCAANCQRSPGVGDHASRDLAGAGPAIPAVCVCGDRADVPGVGDRRVGVGPPGVWKDVPFMKRFLLVLGACALTTVSIAGAGGQQSDAPVQPTPPGNSPEVIAAWGSQRFVDEQFGDRPGRDVVRIGSDYVLSRGQHARELVAVSRTGTVEVRTRGDTVVIFGQSDIRSTAEISGNLVLIDTDTTVAEGARVLGDLVVIGGQFNAPADFAAGGSHVIIDNHTLGGRLAGVFTWITRGLLWGRPIVPQLRWMWAAVIILFLVYLLVSLVFEKPVSEVADVLAHRPLSAFGVGLLVLLLIGPISVLLAVSIIGIAVVPLILCALLVAWVIGKVAGARWLGSSIIPGIEDPRRHTVAAFVLGFVLITAAYMVPILGFVTWTMMGVFGLGASALAFVAAYRRENPPPVPREVGPAPFNPGVYQPGQEAKVSSETSSVALEQPSSTSAVSMPSVIGSLPHASFRDRIAAGALDLILVVITWQFLNEIRGGRAFFLLLLLYHIAFWTWKGTTVGGIICQLRIVRTDGSPLRFADALVRALSAIFSIVVLGLGMFWILRDPERQAWHDRIAGTYVVKVPRNWPL